MRFDWWTLALQTVNFTVLVWLRLYLAAIRQICCFLRSGPFVSVTAPIIDGGLTWEEKGARTTILFEIKNVGKSPAFDISVQAEWSGSYEGMQRAQQRLMYVIPITLAIISVLLYLNARSLAKVLIVLMAVVSSGTAPSLAASVKTIVTAPMRPNVSAEGPSQPPRRQSAQFCRL